MLAYFANYQPIGMTGGGLLPSCLDDSERGYRLAGDIETIYPPGGDPFEHVTATCRPGETLVWGQTVSTGGPLPVELVRTNMPTSPLRDARMRITGDQSNASFATRNPDDVPDLPASRASDVILTGLFFSGTLHPRCDDGSSFGFAIPITFKVFGITRHDALPVSVRITCEEAT